MKTKRLLMTLIALICVICLFAVGCNDDDTTVTTPSTTEGEQTTPAPSCQHTATEVRGAVAATCTATGYTGDTYCTACQTLVTKGTTIPVDANAHAMDNGTVTTPATCVQKGVKTFTCTRGCGHSTTEDVAIDPDAHLLDAGTVTKQPNCHETGLKVFVCTRGCGYGTEETLPIVPDAHAMDGGVVTKKPTCTAVGTKTFTCTNGCGHSTTEEVGIVPHTDVYTDLRDGNHRHTCSTCTTVNEVVAHVPVDANGTYHEATCEHLAYTEYVCSKCQATYQVEDANSTLAPHAWGNWIETVPATCTDKGTTRRACDDCDAFEENEIPVDPTAHNYIHKAEEDVAVTCANNGERHSYCEYCDHHKEEITPKTAHNYGTAVDDGNGFFHKTCQNDACDHFALSWYDATTVTASEVNVSQIPTDKSFEVGFKDNISVQLPAAVVSQIGDTNSDMVEIKAGVVDETAKEDLIQNATNLTPEDKKKLEGVNIYNFGVLVGGQSLTAGDTTFAEAVTVTLPYTLKPDEDRNGIVVWWVQEDGTLTSIDNAVFVGEGNEGYVTFTTDHFSYYAVKYEETPAIRCARGEHEWQELVDLFVEATCMNNGYKVRECLHCKKRQAYDFTERLDHVWGDEIHPTVDCENGGWIIKECQNDGCDAISNISYVRANGHTPDGVATCTTPSTCTTCGKVIAPALGHNYSDWVTVIEPTETKEGLRRRHCDRCGKIEEVRLAPEIGEIDPIVIENWDELYQKLLAIAFESGNGRFVIESAEEGDEGMEYITFTITVVKNGDRYDMYIDHVVKDAEGTVMFEDTLLYRNGVLAMVTYPTSEQMQNPKVQAMINSINAGIRVPYSYIYEIAEQAFDTYNPMVEGMLAQIRGMLDELVAAYGDMADAILAECGVDFTVVELYTKLDSIQALYSYIAQKLGFETNVTIPDGAVLPDGMSVVDAILKLFHVETLEDGSNRYAFDIAPMIEDIKGVLAWVKAHLDTPMGELIYELYGDQIAQKWPELTDWNAIKTAINEMKIGDMRVSTFVDEIINTIEGIEGLTIEEVYALINSVVASNGVENFDIEAMINAYYDLTLDEFVEEIAAMFKLEYTCVQDVLNVAFGFLDGATLDIMITTPNGTLGDLIPMAEGFLESYHVVYTFEMVLDKDGNLVSFELNSESGMWVPEGSLDGDDKEDEKEEENVGGIIIDGSGTIIGGNGTIIGGMTGGTAGDSGNKGSESVIIGGNESSETGTVGGTVVGTVGGNGTLTGNGTIIGGNGTIIGGNGTIIGDGSVNIGDGNIVGGNGGGIGVITPGEGGTTEGGTTEGGDGEEVELVYVSMGKVKVTFVRDETIEPTIPDEIVDIPEQLPTTSTDEEGNLTIGNLDPNFQYDVTLEGGADFTMEELLVKDEELSEKYGLEVYALNKAWGGDRVTYGNFVCYNGKYYHYTIGSSKKIVTEMVKLSDITANPNNYLPNENTEVVAYYTVNGGEELYPIYGSLMGLMFCQDNEWYLFDEYSSVKDEIHWEYDPQYGNLAYQKYSFAGGVPYLAVMEALDVASLSVGSEHFFYNGTEYMGIGSVFLKYGDSFSWRVDGSEQNGVIYLINERTSYYEYPVILGDEFAMPDDAYSNTRYNNNYKFYLNGQLLTGDLEIRTYDGYRDAYYVRFGDKFFHATFSDMPSGDSFVSIEGVGSTGKTTVTVGINGVVKTNVTGLSTVTLPDGNTMYVLGTEEEGLGYYYGYVDLGGGYYAEAVAPKNEAGEIDYVVYRGEAEGKYLTFERYFGDISEYITKNTDGTIVVSAELIDLLKELGLRSGRDFAFAINLIGYYSSSTTDYALEIPVMTHYNQATFNPPSFGPSSDDNNNELAWYYWFDYNARVVKNRDGSITIYMKDVDQKVDVSFNGEAQARLNPDDLTYHEAMSAAIGLNVYVRYERSGDNTTYVKINGKYYNYSTSSKMFYKNCKTVATPLAVLREKSFVIERMDLELYDEENERLIYRTSIGSALESYKGGFERYTTVIDGEIYVLTGAEWEYNIDEFGTQISEPTFKYEGVRKLSEWYASLTLVESKEEKSLSGYLNGTETKVYEKTYDVMDGDREISEVYVRYYTEGGTIYYLTDWDTSYKSSIHIGNEVEGIEANRFNSYSWMTQYDGVDYELVSVETSKERLAATYIYSAGCFYEVTIWDNGNDQYTFGGFKNSYRDPMNLNEFQEQNRDWKEGECVVEMDGKYYHITNCEFETRIRGEAGDKWTHKCLSYNEIGTSTDGDTVYEVEGFVPCIWEDQSTKTLYWLDNGEITDNVATMDDIGDYEYWTDIVGETYYGYAETFYAIFADTGTMNMEDFIQFEIYNQYESYYYGAYMEELDAKSEFYIKDACGIYEGGYTVYSADICVNTYSNETLTAGDKTYEVYFDQYGENYLCLNDKLLPVMYYSESDDGYEFEFDAERAEYYEIRSNAIDLSEYVIYNAETGIVTIKYELVEAMRIFERGNATLSITGGGKSNFHYEYDLWSIEQLFEEGFLHEK